MQILINNKKAYFNYEILEKYVAGIELFGFEVKSIKAGVVADTPDVWILGSVAENRNRPRIHLLPKSVYHKKPLHFSAEVET